MINLHGIEDMTHKHMMDAAHATLWACIQNNLEQPKPHHKNKDLMTALLKLELRNCVNPHKQLGAGENLANQPAPHFGGRNE